MARRLRRAQPTQRVVAAPSAESVASRALRRLWRARGVLYALPGDEFEVYAVRPAHVVLRSTSKPTCFLEFTRAHPPDDSRWRHPAVRK